MPYVSTLGDYPFKATVDWILGSVTGSTYDQAIDEIYKAVNYNAFVNRNFWERLNPIKTIAGETYRKEQVENIINTYVNLIMSDISLPEYDAPNADSAEMAALIAQIAKISAETPELTKLCLNQLYWGTKDGRIKSSKILHPRTYEITKATTKTPENVDSWKNTALNLGNWTSNLGTYLLVGAGVAALYFGSKIVKNVKDIKND